jgi:hypothetical protein
MTPAAELTAELLGRGLTQSEIARSLHRDSRMVTKILRGETSGAVYERTLRDLVEKGFSNYVPPRRRTKQGKPVRIRSRVGEKSVEPAADDMGGPVKPQPARTRFSSQTSFGTDGFRIHDITLPKSRNTPGREKGENEIKARLRNAARGQRYGDRDLKFTVTLKNGQQVTVGDKGGYHSSQVLKLVAARDKQLRDGTLSDLKEQQKYGSGVVGWLTDQLINRMGSPLPMSLKGTDITGVSISVYPSEVHRAPNRASTSSGGAASAAAP